MLDTVRFLKAQDEYYEKALAEIKSGRKRSHWIWFIFPQLTALGRSETARYYGIDSLADARAYLECEVLRSRLYEITKVLLTSLEKNPILLMGGYVDAVKLRSSMTLFSKADPDNPLFREVLDTFFEGKEDPYTLKILSL